MECELGRILPELQYCSISKFYRTFYIGYVRYSNDVLKDTWLWISPRNKINTRTGDIVKTEAEKKTIEEGIVPVIPEAIFEFWSRIFEARHKVVLQCLRQLNLNRVKAYEQVLGMCD